jgi:hypothetical protein
VAGCCECGDEPLGSCATELVIKVLCLHEARKLCYTYELTKSRLSNQAMRTVHFIKIFHIDDIRSTFCSGKQNKDMDSGL